MVAAATRTRNGRPVKLGCIVRPHNPDAMQLCKYLDLSSLPTPPASTNWRAKPTGKWQMFLNDSIGDCTIAETCNQIISLAANSGTAIAVPTDAQVLAAYEAVTGIEGAAYDPTTGINDNGCVIADVLAYWQKTGIAGNQIGGSASIDPKDHATICAGVDLLGGLSVGLSVPEAWLDATTWDAPSMFHRIFHGGQWQIAGGHCVYIVDYDSTGLYAVTWGEVVNVTWAGWDAYFTEAHAILDQLWFNGSKVAPDGFDLAALTADLQALNG